jgi:ATP-binding cassette subfamily B (MDR/TAP) protein 1
VVFGQLVGEFTAFSSEQEKTHFEHELKKGVLYFVYIAIGMFVTTCISTAGFISAGEQIVRRIRQQYLAALLRQNIAFFDSIGAGEITTRLTADTTTIQDGISEKVPLAVSALSTFVAAMTVSFVYNWRLALILSSILIALLLSIVLCSTWLIKWTAQSQEVYIQAGTLAEEVLSTMRNTTAFSSQEKLAHQYDQHLAKASHWGRKTQTLLGFMIAMGITITFLNYVSRFLTSVYVKPCTLPAVLTPFTGACVLAGLAISGHRSHNCG